MCVAMAEIDMTAEVWRGEAGILIIINGVWRGEAGILIIINGVWRGEALAY